MPGRTINTNLRLVGAASLRRYPTKNKRKCRAQQCVAKACGYVHASRSSCSNLIVDRSHSNLYPAWAEAVFHAVLTTIRLLNLSFRRRAICDVVWKHIRIIQVGNAKKNGGAGREKVFVQ